MKNKLRKIVAFTLAEVLITLTILGIVASLTIPTMIQNTQDQEMKVAWKKAFKDLSEITMRIKGDNAGTLKGAFNSSNNMMNKYVPYMAYVKSCYYGSSLANCWHSAGTTKWLNNTTATDFNLATLVLNNGSMLNFDWENTNCNSAVWSSPMGYRVCGGIRVDVNGLKGPNIYGKDIFAVYVYEKGIMPWGVDGGSPDADTDCSNSGLGYVCSMKYLYTD